MVFWLKLSFLGLVDIFDMAHFQDHALAKACFIFGCFETCNYDNYYLKFCLKQNDVSTSKVVVLKLLKFDIIGHLIESQKSN